MQRDVIREVEINEKTPRRPWGEMAVVADPDDLERALAGAGHPDDQEEEIPATLPEPIRPPTPSRLDRLDVERAEGEGMTRE